MQNKIRKIGIITIAALLAQTNGTIDMTSVVAVLTSILPVILTVMVIAMVFKMLAGMFDSFGSVFRWVKLAPIALLAQTNETIDITATTAIVTQVLYAVLPVILTVAVISLVLKMFGKLTDVFRWVKLAPVLFLAQTSTEQAQQIASTLSQLMMPLLTIVLLIALPILVFKVITKAVLDIAGH